MYLLVCIRAVSILRATALRTAIIPIYSDRAKEKPLTLPYMLGLEWFPILSWMVGTICGGVANNLLPASVQSALGIALYGMFVAIVLPGVEEEKSVMFVAIAALVLSCLFYYMPGLNKVSSGFVIIICTLLASGLGAAFFPLKEETA